MQYLKRRGDSFQFQLQVPPDVLQRFRPGFKGSRLLVTKGMGTDKAVAEAKALELAGRYKVKFELLRGRRALGNAEARRVYEHELERHRQEHPERGGEDALDLTLDAIIDRAEKRGWRQHDEDDRDYEPPPLPADLQAEWDAAVDYSKEISGKSVAKRDDYALAFSESAAQYLNSRKGQLKGQTVSQHEAIYRLFADFIEDKPLRKVTRQEAVSFFDKMAEFDPDWGRSPTTKKRTFADLAALYSGRGRRLSARTLNRYATHLAPLWNWANGREGFASASTPNPFSKIAKKPKRRQGTYLPLETEELNALFGRLPAQPWLWEVALVALYSGMRAVNSRPIMTP